MPLDTTADRLPTPSGWVLAPPFADRVSLSSWEIFTKATLRVNWGAPIASNLLSVIDPNANFLHLSNGLSLPLSYMANVTRTAGPHGMGVYSAGSYGGAGASSSLFDFNEPFTAMAWGYYLDLSGSTIRAFITHGSLNENRKWWAGTDTNTVFRASFIQSGGSQVDVTTPIFSVPVLANVVIGWDGTNGWIGINGSWKNSAAVSSLTTGVTAPLQIHGNDSRSPIGWTYAGALWKGRFLSNAELLSLYQMPGQLFAADY